MPDLFCYKCKQAVKESIALIDEKGWGEWPSSLVYVCNDCLIHMTKNGKEDKL